MVLLFLFFLNFLPALKCADLQMYFAAANFSTNKTRIAYGGYQSYCMVADLNNPQVDTLLGNQHKKSALTSLCFTPDDQKIIAGSEHGKILIWDINNTQLIQKIDKKFKSAPMQHLKHLNATQIAAVQRLEKKSIKILDINTKKTVAKLPDYQDIVQALEILDENIIILADHYATNVWDLRANKITNSLPNTNSITRGIAIDKHSSSIALGKSTNNDGNSAVELWDSRIAYPLGKISYKGFLSHGIEKLSFAEQSNILAFVADQSLMVVNTIKPQEQYRSKLVLTATILALSSAENSFLIAQETGEIKKIYYQEPA